MTDLIEVGMSTALMLYLAQLTIDFALDLIGGKPLSSPLQERRSYPERNLA